VDRPSGSPSQKAGGKLGTRKMTERLSRLAVVCYQQTYTRAYLGARDRRESTGAGRLNASPFTYPCYPVLALSSNFSREMYALRRRADEKGERKEKTRERQRRRSVCSPYGGNSFL